MKKILRRERQTSLDGLPPLLARLYAGRGVRTLDDVDFRLSGLPSPTTLKGLTEAAGLLSSSIAGGERILIVGDFDADGATSCALLVSGLEALGANDVDYLVPNRFEYGYGLTPEIVDVASARNPSIIVTVDNGISSIAGVAHARSLGINVIITDHHLPGATLPDANAIVNPNQPGCEFPSKHLAGVGVAFYLLSAVRSALRDAGALVATNEPVLADWLDLVALGTIADVVVMDRTNRILAAEGLRRIRGGRSRPGILALLQIAGADPTRVTSRDLAFAVAPRLNAAGRLEDMSVGIECLLTMDAGRASDLAEQLNTLNAERKEIESTMRTQAEEALAKMGEVSTKNLSGVCLFDESWHQGVVGIVASRIKDRIHRPVIAFARSGDNELKGSARSISGLHIRDALDAIAARQPDLVVKFGGHAMAAGLSLLPENLPRFRAAFDEEASRWLTAADLEQVIYSDGEIESMPSVQEVAEIGAAAPWGQGFPEPSFDGEFELVEQRIVGGHHLKLKVRPINSDDVIDAIAFNHDRLVENRFQRLAYRLDVNEWRGRASLQLIVEAVGVTL